MFLAGLDDDFRVAKSFHFCGKHGAKFLARFGGNASRTAVGDDAFCIERGEVGAGANVAGFKFHAQAKRFNHAAADLEFQRVIAEQTEMSRPAAGRDAGRNGNHAALRRVFCQRIQVRRDGGLQRREIILFLRGDVAQAVEHDQREFGFGFQCQFGIKRVQIHAGILQQARRSAMRFRIWHRSVNFLTWRARILAVNVCAHETKSLRPRGRGH